MLEKCLIFKISFGLNLPPYIRFSGSIAIDFFGGHEKINNLPFLSFLPHTEMVLVQEPGDIYN